MDQEILVSELRDVVARFEKREGPVVLLLLAGLEAAGVNQVWNVIVSSPAFDHVPRSVALRKLSDYLRRSVDESFWPVISRTTVLRTDDPFVKNLIGRRPKLGSGATLHSLIVSGVEIPEAVVVEAKQLAA
jgi:hypothetical protein